MSPCLRGVCFNRRDTIRDLIRARYGWLLLFFFGLMLAALVVEAFESVLRAHVELSMFVPLLIGHGGNTGSQSNATVIRSLALGHLKPSDWLLVVYKVGGWVGWLRVWLRCGAARLGQSCARAGPPRMQCCTAA